MSVVEADFNDPNDSTDGEKKALVNTFGEKRKYDPMFKGPIKSRGCTDIICCILISAYMIGMVVVGVIAFLEGDPSRLLYATDSNGKVCGIDHPNKKFLHFFDLTDCAIQGFKDPLAFAKKGLSCPTPQVCVESCNTFNEFGPDVSWQKMVCIEGVTVDETTTKGEKEKLIKEEKCAPYYLDSTDVFYRCLPSALADTITSLGLVKADGNKLNGSSIQLGETAIQILLNFENLSMQILDEMKAVWIWVLIGFILSMVISILYIVLARWITFPLVIVTMVGVLGLMGYAIYYTFAKYMYLVDSETSKEIIWRISLSVDDFARNKTTWLVIGIILSITFLILFLIIIFLIPRVRIASALISETSRKRVLRKTLTSKIRGVCTMISTLFFPLIPWLFQLVWFAWFLVILMYLMSNGRKQYQVSHNDTSYNLTLGDGCDHELFKSQYPDAKAMCLFAKYEENPNLLRMQVFHFFGWLWGSQFIIAFAEASLAGAFASYYWAFNKKKDLQTFPVMSAMWRTLRKKVLHKTLTSKISYHTGSLALGAAIVAIVKLIRVTLEYIHRKLKENTDNPVANFIMKCLKCCFWCLEKCLRFLNKNAYIMIAIYGKNFCSSAKEAFSLLIRNPARKKVLHKTLTSKIRVLAINGITGFILFLGKLLVTGGIGVGSFFWFARYNAFLPDKLDYTIVPILICTIGAYLVTVLFFNVYDMGIDTLFLCFLEDLERNDGSPEKPYYMTKELQRIMSKQNRRPTVVDDQNMPLN